MCSLKSLDETQFCSFRENYGCSLKYLDRSIAKVSGRKIVRASTKQDVLGNFKLENLQNEFR